MNNNEISLKGLDENNWYECCELEVSKEQVKYMEPNAISIAQSKFEDTLMTFAIYKGEEIVGFLMYNSVKEELDSYWIYRIMIDKKHQGKGIGKAATKLMIEEMKKLPECNKITVGYHPDNLGAHNLYANLGFVDKGDRFGQEMATVLELEN